MSLRTVTVKLEDATLAGIEAEAQARRLPRSAIMRERLGRKTRQGSVWAMMHDLVVDSDSAPADLSSNKARLKGYGGPRSR